MRTRNILLLRQRWDLIVDDLSPGRSSSVIGVGAARECKDRSRDALNGVSRRGVLEQLTHLDRNESVVHSLPVLLVALCVLDLALSSVDGAYAK